MRHRKILFLFLSTWIFAGPGMGLAETETQPSAADFQQLQQQIQIMQQQMEEMKAQHAAEMEAMQKKIEALEKNQGTQPAEPPQAEKIAELLKTAEQQSASNGKTTELGRAIQSFNPDLSAIGDVLFHSEHGDKVDKDRFEFRELELALSSPVDTFGRADFFVGFEQEDSEWHTNLEEGYFTLNSLPDDLQARFGKFYSAFGKANAMHTHAMPWVDKPNMIQNFFGEEGMSETGAEISWLVPNPWDHYMELTFEVQNNGNSESFGGTNGDKLMYVSHLKNFFDLHKDSTLELGGSVATGTNDNDGGNHRTCLEGLDLTYKWRPAEEGLYKSLTWMNEILFSQNEQDTGDYINSTGFYTSPEYQFSRRWSVFGRYDYSEFPDDNDSQENAYTAGLTFRQSEYAFWRFSGKHTEGDYATKRDVSMDEFWVQFNFGIGPHRAHKY
jgi:hypothetical protein